MVATAERTVAIAASRVAKMSDMREGYGSHAADGSAPYDDRMSWAALTAIGTVLAGLALPLAFIQLGALRQDRLRTQVAKVGAWTGPPGQDDEDASSWSVQAFVRNGSELPVRIDGLELRIRPWGYLRTLAAPEGTTEVDYYADKRFGDSKKAYLRPGTIAPGSTWSVWQDCAVGASFEYPRPPITSIARVVITDAAGYQWEFRSDKAGPARRVRQWRRWYWKRRGSL